MITYNIELDFSNESQKKYWIDLLNSIKNCYNSISKLVWENKSVKLNLKEIHSLVYNDMRKSYPELPAQAIIKTYKSVISSYRSNKRKFFCEKKKSSCQLDKRLYSKLSPEGLLLSTPNSFKREFVSFKLYKKFKELSLKYSMHDPNIFVKNNKLYLGIPFEVPSKPVVEETYLGIDLGVKRLVTTSDGVVIDDKKLKANKRRIRKLKRELQSKKTRSAKQKLRKLRNKERNINKFYVHKIVNSILKTDKNIIVTEDLSGIKQNTSRTKEGFKRNKHNNRMSQVPFYMLKEILSYKALLLGKRVETVSPYNTSKIDCITNKIDGERRGCRYYSKSGLVYDADWNAAINIRNRKHPESFILPIDGKLNFFGRGLVNIPNISENTEKQLSL